MAKTRPSKAIQKAKQIGLHPETAYPPLRLHLKGEYRHAKSPEDYLNQRLNKDGDCWIWLKGVDKDGYGQCQASKFGKELHVSRSHQMAYVTWVGPIPDGAIICHKCDNPICCNPSHLFAGTWNDNVQDMINKGRRVVRDKPNPKTAEIVDLYGKKSCFDTAKQVGYSFSTVCRIWREHGLSGKNWHLGNKVK